MLVMQAAIGFVLLFFGRPLFWAFVALVGFLVGAHLSQTLLANQPAWVGVLVALGVGIVGALLAMVAERVAFALGGLLAGGYLALAIKQSLHLGGSETVWFAIAGVICALVAIWIMDWAIIVLSCLVGAGAVVESLVIRPGMAVVVYLILVTLGVLFQAARYQRYQRVEPTPDR